MEYINTLASFIGFCSGAVEVSIILGCGVVSLDDWCPVIGDNVVASC